MAYLSSYNWLSDVRRDPDFKNKSEKLSKYMNRDFSPIRDVIKEMFPFSYDRRLPRDVPIVQSISKQSATHYRRAPNRVWTLPSGEPLSPNQTEALRSFYNLMKVDELFKRINESVVVQSTITGVILPIPGTNLFQASIFEPWEVEVDPGGASNCESVQDVAKNGEFRFRVPVASTYDRVQFGCMKINSERAVVEFQGKTSGVFTESGALPEEFFGRVPIFSCRLGKAPAGSYFSPLKNDLITVQESVSLGFSDIDHAARMSSWPQKVVTNCNRAELESMVFGPDFVISMDDEQDLKYASGQTNLKDYQESQENFLKYVTIHNDLNPAQFVSGHTAVSKMVDMADRDAMRQDHLVALRQLENEFYSALKLLLNAGVKSDSWPVARVEVEYKEIPLPENKLQLQQAQRMTFEDGLSSPSRELAKEQNISLEEAKRRIEENLVEYRMVKKALMDDPTEVVEVER